MKALRVIPVSALLAVLTVFSSCGGDFPPGTPTNLTATAASASKVDLTWSASSNASAYRVYRDDARVAEVNATSYSDTGLTGNTEYCYRVSAINGSSNESDKTVERCVTTNADTQAPTTPTGLTATVASATQIDLAWTASTDDNVLSGYKIYRNSAQAATSASASYSDISGLASGTTYCYEVSAFDASGNESAKSNQACATPGPLPSVPQYLVATLATSKRIEFSWDASTDSTGAAVASYKVFGHSDGFTNAIGTSTVSAFSHTGLTTATTYCYRVSAIDSAGRESDKSSQLCQETLSAASWVVSSIDKAGDMGQYASMSIGPDNKIHVGYYDASNGDLKYAIKNGALWEKTTVDATGDVGQYASLSLDSGGYAHVSYYDATNAALKYATNSSGGWVKETIDSNVSAQNTDIAIDGAGNVHVGFTNSANSVAYRTKDSSGWSNSVAVDASGVDVSLAVDSNGVVVISYKNLSNGDLKIAAGDETGFSNTAVDTGSTGYTSVALDSGNVAHIGYYDFLNGDLKYATGDISSGFSKSSVDTSGDVGGYCSIAVSGVNVYISYYDFTNGALKYVTGAYGSFSTPVTVDSSGDVGLYTSIALDSAGAAHIVYYDGGNFDLKYAIFE